MQEKMKRLSLKEKRQSLNNRDKYLSRMVCDAFQPRPPLLRGLLDRLQRNEAVHDGALLLAANLWKKKNNKKGRLSTHCDETKFIYQINQFSYKTRVSGNSEVRKKKNLGRFKIIAQKVCLLTKVFRRLHEFARENGGHDFLCTGAMQLKDRVVDNAEQKDLLFNAQDYITKYQASFPRWARDVCGRQPDARSPMQIQNIVNLMRQLKDFRKYSTKMLSLLAKIVRYERFGRRRVIVRKGHIGIGFYVIFSGSVGVVIGVDEDKAFENEEGPANVMKRGDSFGELALVRRSNRSATVVCFENTEFFVIDKAAFYESGIDKCAQEEMLFRYESIKSLEMFKGLNDATIKEVAEGGRNIEYLSDRVVEADSTQSEYIYIITKGTCDVLRLIDLNTQDYLSKKLKHKPISLCGSSGYWSKNTSRSCTPQATLPVYNSSPNAKPTSSKVSSQVSDGSSDQGSKVQFSEGCKSNMSLASGNANKTDERRFCGRRQSISSPEIFNGGYKKLQRTMPTVISNLSKNLNSYVTETIQKKCATTNLGLGAYIRIDNLTSGHVFGAKYLLPEEEQVDCGRKFVLLSTGCEVVRISKTALKMHLDEHALQTIKAKLFQYPSDEQLYKIFISRNKWRSFREQLVDHIVEHRNNVDKALKERSATITNLPNVNELTTPRSISPSKQWRVLVDEKLVQENSSNWSISPRPTSKAESHYSPFLQETLVQSKGSQRMLVLTHGGSRVNKLQASTNSKLVRHKKHNRLMNYVQQSS